MKRELLTSVIFASVALLVGCGNANTSAPVEQQQLVDEEKSLTAETDNLAQTEEPSDGKPTFNTLDTWIYSIDSNEIEVGIYNSVAKTGELLEKESLVFEDYTLLDVQDYQINEGDTLLILFPSDYDVISRTAVKNAPEVKEASGGGDSYYLELTTPVSFDMGFELANSEKIEISFNFTDSEVSNENLKGKIKTEWLLVKSTDGVWHCDECSHYLYDRKGFLDNVYGSDISAGFYQESTYEYSNDNLIKEIHYYASGQEKETFDYEYDSENRLISEHNISMNKAGEYSEYLYAYEYDDNGRIIKCTTTTDDISWDTEYEYDENGNLIVDRNGKYEYSDNQLVKKIIMIYEINYEYDADGNLLFEKGNWGSDYCYCYSYY